MTISGLMTSEYNPYYQQYIDLVPADTNLLSGMESGRSMLVQFFEDLPTDKLMYRYEPNKWSVKEILQHIIDTERVFMYRCFRIGRMDPTPLSGFEQDDYIQPSGANGKDLSELLLEYETGRQGFITLIKSFTDENLKFMGNASGANLTARATGFMILGHEIHHVNVIRDRYL